MMTQRYYIHPLRISHTYTVCFDHIHAPSSTSNSPWTHIFFCFRILQTPLPPNILLPTPRFLKKIPRSTISAAHTAYVSGASHGAWRHTSDPKEKWLSHPQRLQLPTAASTAHSSSIRDGPSWAPASVLPGFGGAVTDFSPYWSCACNYSSSMSLTARSMSRRQQK